jgi:N-acetylmuramoyl-L-alanine amidase
MALALSLILAALAASPGVALADGPLPRLVDIRFDRKADHTRTVFEFTSLPYYRSFDEQLSREYFYIDFYEVDVAAERGGQSAGEGGRLKMIARRAYPESRTLRIILGTDRVRPYVIQTLERPARVVVDIYDPGKVPHDAPNQRWRLTEGSDSAGGAGGSSTGGGSGSLSSGPRSTIAFASSSDYSAPPIRFHASAQPTPTRKLRVVVDPGHGGRDPGALSRLRFSGQQAEEKDYALAIALEMARLAATDPSVEVILTRKADTYMSLQDRVEFAEKQNPDLFLSLHFNSVAPGSNASGPEFFTLSSKGQGQLERRIVRSMSTNQRSSPSANSQAIVGRMARDRVRRLTAESLRFSAAIESALQLDPYYRGRNRGQKTANFYVLKNAVAPSVLVEIGFMTDTGDAKRHREAGERQKVAKLMLDAVKMYGRTSR